MKRIKIKYLVVPIILIFSLTLGAGCDLLPEIEIPFPSQPSPPATDTSPQPAENSTATDPTEPILPAETPTPILPSIADVVAKVKPSVVTINTEAITIDIFNQSRTQEGAGSGWIIRKDGYIVTNNHVVEGAEVITITLDDGRVFTAEMVRTDPLTDLAIVKIDARNLPAAGIGNSDKLRIGDWVVAIGNSLGRGIRATQGIVSRQDVSLSVDRNQTLYGLIETDAAINPGNSGGPLVNMAGEVVGINSVKIAQVGVEGVGYAISSNAALPIIQQLIDPGYVIRPWLGVSLYPVNQSVIETFNLAIDKGAFVVEVVAGSPAGKAGLQREDIIVAFGGREIDTVDDLIQTIRSAQVGQEVAITYWRGDTENTTQATLIERPTSP